MNQKVTVVGAGNVGAAVASQLVEKELCDVVLFDIIEGLAQGKTLDLAQAAPLEKRDARLIGTSDYAWAANSDIIVITAGIARRPGMSRNDLLATNRSIMKDVVGKISRHAPDAILMIVSNPIDALCHVALEESRFPKERVIGMAGALDSARLSAFIAMELQVSVENVSALVLGSHSDHMLPLPRYATVAGIPITEWLPPDRIDALMARTRKAGAEIMELLKTGSAYFAPASAVADMVSSILKDKKKVLPCAAYLEGEYGISGLYVGVPVILGKSGIEKIITLHLTEDELKALHTSADAVQELLSTMKGMP